MAVAQEVEDVVEVAAVAVDEVAALPVSAQLVAAAEHSCEQALRRVAQRGQRGGELGAAHAQNHLGRQGAGRGWCGWSQGAACGTAGSLACGLM